MKASSRSTGLAAAALFSAAAAWALHQKVGYLIASFACGRRGEQVWIVTGLALLILGAGALTSWSVFANRPPQADDGPSEPAAPRRFLATVGLMSGGVFLFAIALQACAAVFLPPCAS
jgi:hypothetical protein